MNRLISDHIAQLEREVKWYRLAWLDAERRIELLRRTMPNPDGTWTQAEIDAWYQQQQSNFPAAYVDTAATDQNAAAIMAQEKQRQALGATNMYDSFRPPQ